MRVIYLLFVFLISCGARIGQLAPRASFDLGCPQDKLEYTEIDDETQGVSGCGNQGTYVWTCNTKGFLRSGGNLYPIRKCQWVRN